MICNRWTGILLAVLCQLRMKDENRRPGNEERTHENDDDEA
jgi:hypothetical protein